MQFILNTSEFPVACILCSHSAAYCFGYMRRIAVVFCFCPVSLCLSKNFESFNDECYFAFQFQSLFAATCTLPVVQKMWDLYFQQDDPFFVFFLALVMVVNAR